MQTPIQKAINAVLTRGSNVDRPSVITQNGGFLSGNLSATSGGSQEAINSMGSVGWLFAVIERISTSLAASEWKLYVERNGEREEITDHPLLDIWKNPNPFYSQSEFLEDSSNHFELTGEMAWVIVRGLGGAIVELWPVRPDRIKPVPDKDDYISGYIYQVGSEAVPLETDDVIFMRRPHPTVPYRGIGQVQTLLHDIGSEQLASAWQRNFFANSALPSGIIELDHNLSPMDFQRLVERWREQHQGVSNAHRVAILERGKWTERKFTQADMQFKEIRMLNRDLILGAYGFPTALLGISENVNKANADAAELMFARWLIRPRLIRIRDKMNQTLVSQFDSNLFMDFTDPVPADKTSDLAEGEKGYNAGILTQNEARQRLGEGAIAGGDEFKQGGQINPIPAIIASFGDQPPKETLSDQREPALVGEGDVYHSEDRIEGDSRSTGQVKRDNDPLLPSLIERAEAEMQKGWTRRLRHEMLALISALSLNVRSTGSVQKLEATDLEHHDWDWETKYGDDVRAELTEAFDATLREAGYLEQEEVEEAGVQADVQKLEFTEPITYSVAYARSRAARLLTLGSDLSLVNTVRQRVRFLVADTINRRESVQYLARSLRADNAFSPSKAQTIARTETATAYGQGTHRAALSQGRDEKRWTTQGDDAVDGGIGGPCIDNEMDGWIKISKPFISGHDMTPAHPNCRCIVRYRTAELHGVSSVETPPVTKTIDLARCEHCNKLLQKNYVGGTLYCSRCKNETTFIL
jgi:HK97 family phage portal protein